MVTPGQITIGIVFSTIFILLIVLLLLYLISLYNKRLIIKERDFQERIFQNEANALRRIIASQENEKTRIAKNLHDDVGPLLSLVKINLSSLKTKDIVTVQNMISQQSLLIGTVIGQIKNTCYDLSPSFLIKFGLPAALKEFGSNFTQENPLGLIGFENYPQMELNAQTNVYRILTEIMNNALKYGQGKAFQLEFSRDDNFLIFTFSYEGNGINQKEFEELIDSGSTLGLKNIQERLILLKGSVLFNKNNCFVNTTTKIPVTHVA